MRCCFRTGWLDSDRRSIRPRRNETTTCWSRLRRPCYGWISGGICRRDEARRPWCAGTRTPATTTLLPRRAWRALTLRRTRRGFGQSGASRPGAFEALDTAAATAMEYDRAVAALVIGIDRIVANVGIQVDSAFVADRISLKEPPQVGRIESRLVMIEPNFTEPDLAITVTVTAITVTVTELRQLR